MSRSPNGLIKWTVGVVTALLLGGGGTYFSYLNSNLQQNTQNIHRTQVGQAELAAKDRELETRITAMFQQLERLERKIDRLEQKLDKVLELRGR